MRLPILVGMQKVDLVFFDAGGGHRSAAEALRVAIQQQRRPWEVRLVNLQEVLEPLDFIRRFTGIRMQEVYNRILRRGWTAITPPLLRMLQLTIRVLHPLAANRLAEHWARTQPNLVVSLIPNFNRTMWQGLRKFSPSVPYVTVLTDLADYPPHFWFEPQKQYVVCATERAVAQAKSVGHPVENIFRTSGMIVHPRFYEAQMVERGEGRRQLGLQPDWPTALVLFGGYGSRAMLEIAERLERVRHRLQVIFIAGRNRPLADKLRARSWRYPCFVEEFTRDVPYYMHLCDFFIGKPGTTSISEALVAQLPLILERNAGTMPQERYNADWAGEQGVGVLVRSFTEVHLGVEELLNSQNLARIRGNVAALNNRSVFEIPDLLQAVLRAC
jgi:1,2-diacylglycerol 3-beta-galactosyltransferase